MRPTYKSILKRTIKPSGLAAAIFLACVSGASADTVTMQLIGPPPGPYLANIYTSPYTATINGVATPVICDDFYTDVSTSTPPWTATVTNMATIQQESSFSTDVKFGNNPPSGQAPWGASLTPLQYQIEGYSIVGYLSTELQAYDPNSQQAMDLSYSIWQVFDWNSANSNVTPFDWLLSNGYAADQANAAAYLQGAINAYNANQIPLYSNIYIYTPVPQSASQEYIYVGSVPEGTNWGLLGIGLLALLFVRLRTRNLISATVPSR